MDRLWSLETPAVCSFRAQNAITHGDALADTLVRCGVDVHHAMQSACQVARTPNVEVRELSRRAVSSVMYGDSCASTSCRWQFNTTPRFTPITQLPDMTAVYTSFVHVRGMTGGNFNGR